MDPAPIACPACARRFRNKHGLGGHLTTVSDPAHESYRAAHGLPAKTPKARISQAKKEAKALAAANPAPSRPSPAVPVPVPTSPPPASSIAADPAPQDPPPAQPSPSKGDGLRSALQVAIEDYRRQTADAPSASKPKAKKAAKPTNEDDAPAIMSNASGALAGAGIAAGVIGLVRLIGSLKGAKQLPPKAPAPATPQFYGLPPPPPPPKPQDMPPWMSSFNVALPFQGGLPPGQQREWWWL